MAEIQEILTELVIESVKKYIDPMTKLELPTLSVQTAIEIAADQIEQQQQGRGEKVIKELKEADKIIAKLLDMCRDRRQTIIPETRSAEREAALAELESTDG